MLEAAPSSSKPFTDAAMPAAPDFPPAPDAVKPARALISLSDKTGLEAAARALHDAGVELVSTGGTLRANQLRPVTTILESEAVIAGPDQRLEDGRQ